MDGRTKHIGHRVVIELVTTDCGVAHGLEQLARTISTAESLVVDCKHTMLETATAFEAAVLAFMEARSREGGPTSAVHMNAAARALYRQAVAARQ